VAGSTVGDGVADDVAASGCPEVALRGAASEPDEQPVIASTAASAAQATREREAAVRRLVAAVLIAVHCVIPPTLAGWPTRWRRAP
jgi:hypothetical protein